MGERSLGKSVALNSLFLTDIYNENCKSSTKRIGEEITVDKIPIALTENGVNLVLEVIDVPGYAAFKDNSKSWEAIARGRHRAGPSGNFQDRARVFRGSGKYPETFQFKPGPLPTPGFITRNRSTI